MVDAYLGFRRSDDALVRIDELVRRKHMALFGKSGVGKTTLLRNMILGDLQNGAGLTVVDPHGSLIEDILDFIPPHRMNDVIVLDPSDPNRIVGLNVLESIHSQQRSLVVSSIISILRNLHPLNWGPRTEYILEHAVYALLGQKQPVTLAALPRLLVDPEYRAAIVKNVSDPAVRAFFTFYENQNDRLREESIAPLLNKVSKFVTNPLLRAVIGQPTSSFDFRWLMDSGKILLCNLSKGALGDDVSSLLGSLVVTKLALASLSRQDIPESQRRTHVLYCDEVQNFTHGMPLPVILAESRKYALALVVASQSLTQLPTETVAAIFGNCATIGTFRVSGDDAHRLVREFAASGEGPRLAEQMYDLVVPAEALQNLPDYQLYIRTLGEQGPIEPFHVASFPPLLPKGRVAKNALHTSLARYGRDRRQVESSMNRFLRDSGTTSVD